MGVTAFLAGVGYFVLAAGTIRLTSNGLDIASVWPANALLLALVLARPRRAWPAIVIAGFVGNALANIVTRGTVEGPLLYGVANIVEVLIAAWGWQRGARDRTNVLHRPDTVMRFALWAGIVAPLVSGLLGAATAVAVFHQPFLVSLGTWYAADALGLLIFTPFLFALLDGEYVRCLREKAPLQRLETAALIALCALVSLLVFRTDHLPLLFLVGMPVTLVTFRTGWLGTKLAVMVVAVIGAVATMRGAGPISLATSDPRLQALFFQFFLGSLLLSEFPVGAAVAMQKRLLERLAERERALRLLASQSPDMLFSFDENGACRYALGAGEALFGRAPESFIGQDLSALGMRPEALRQAAFKAEEDPGEVWAVEFEPPDHPGRYLEAKIRAANSEDGRWLGTLASIHDITDRKAQERELMRSAMTDALTGLLNRAGFLQRLETAIADSQGCGLCVALIDVDRFKTINDNFGHMTGDSVLREVAVRLTSQIRASDAVGRLGGDEFVVLMSDCDKARARDIGARLVATMNGSVIEADPNRSIHLRVSISCGIAAYQGGWNAAQLIAEADRALYEAKGAGRNRMIAL